MAEERGSIAFFSTYRPPVPLDIFSCPNPQKSEQNELQMTDGEGYNYNGRVIPPPDLETILKHPKLASEGKGAKSGMIFVSERGSSGNLETLHIALYFNDDKPGVPKVKVFNFADVFGTFNGVRMEDGGCIAGDYLVYVSTKEPAARRQPWTAVYKTNLITGITDRLTPTGSIPEIVRADLSPSVSQSGKRIAMASFQNKPGGWDGEIQDLETDIFVMNVDKPYNRVCVVKNGGWPTWGSDNVIFFHRKVEKYWAVFQVIISDSATVTKEPTRVTPDSIHAMTPAAINPTTVAVATIREEYTNMEDDRTQYRHIEIFDATGKQSPVQITKTTRPKADHFNPFVIGGGKSIGYHRCKCDNTEDYVQNEGDIKRPTEKLTSLNPDVGLFRVSGVFPTFSEDGSRLAFVDNEFRAVWVADSKGMRIVHETSGPNNVFSPVWNQKQEKDILYICKGPSFSAKEELSIYIITNVCSDSPDCDQLTSDHNDAFPSTDRHGERLVFRSTRYGGDEKYKNLFILEKADDGDFNEDNVTRLTEGPWTDTHCKWSPTEDWIVFSSTRDKPKDAPAADNDLDPGYFAIFLVKPNDLSVVVRVGGSGNDIPRAIRVIGSGNDLAGHVNHPFFSPDGKSIVVTADLAAVSVDPISLPLVEHSVRPYGDIFTVDIDQLDDKRENKDLEFKRITHSRFENSTATWIKFATNNPSAAWKLVLDESESYTPSCPYAYPDGGESWHMTGHLCIPKRCC